MKPYYEHAGITIYHGDCREILPQLAPADLCLTDPPYGINAARTRNSQQWGWTDFPVTGWDKERATPEQIALTLKAAHVSIIWGGNYWTDCLPLTWRWLIWDKGQTDFSLADAELAWTSLYGAIRRLLLPRAVALREGKQHPTQKPIALMKWCLSFAPDAKTVVDPFCGSGSVLVAAKATGRQAIGIDIEEKYCEIAAKRLSQEVLNFS